MVSSTSTTIGNRVSEDSYHRGSLIGLHINGRKIVPVISLLLLIESCICRFHRLALYIQAMKGLSPLDKLNQGYSYVEKEGKAITSVQDVKEGDLLEICVSDGKITARAEKTSAVSWMEQS